MHNLSHGALSGAIALVLSAAALAQETTTRLDEVVVTAPAMSEPLTVVTDPKAPRQPVPAYDGADYLKTLTDDEDLIRYASFWKFVNRNLFSALEAAQRACQTAPENANAWGILAEVHVSNGNLKEALTAVEKACQLTKSKKDLEKYETLSKQIKASSEKK